MHILYMCREDSPLVGKCIKCHAVIHARRAELMEASPFDRSPWMDLRGPCPVCPDHGMMRFWPEDTQEAGKIMDMIPSGHMTLK